jgi:hypothetical protein
MPYVIIGVKAYEVSAQKPTQYLPPPGQHTEYFQRGEGDMKEKAYRGTGQLLSYKLGQQHQLIIMHPDDIVLLGHLDHGFSKCLVHPLIGLPEILAVYRVLGEIVKERPDSFVAKATVEFSDIPFGEENGMTVFQQEISFNLLFFLFSNPFLFNASPSYPETGVSLLKRAQRSNQTTGTRFKA